MHAASGKTDPACERAGDHFSRRVGILPLAWVGDTGRLTQDSGTPLRTDGALRLLDASSTCRRVFGPEADARWNLSQGDPELQDRIDMVCPMQLRVGARPSLLPERSRSSPLDPAGPDSAVAANGSSGEAEKVSRPWPRWPTPGS